MFLNQNLLFVNFLHRHTDWYAGQPYCDLLGSITGSKLNSSATTSYTYAGILYANPHAPTKIGSTVLGYDNAGNATSSGSTVYAWDWRNRLSTSTVSGTTRIYSYDENDDRMRLDDGTTVYHYPNPLYQSDSVSALPTKHILLNGKDIATIEGATGSGTVTFRYPDHLGSVNIATDNTNTVLQTLDYYPYGSRRINSGSDVSQREYIGQFFDEGPGLSYLNARYYSGTQGQFISQDPVFLSTSQNLSDPQSLNSYSYANGNPIVNKDPSGRCPACLLIGGGALAGLISQGVEDYTGGKEIRWQNYVGAAIGGAVGAASLLTAPELSAFKVGAISQGTEEYATQLLNQASAVASNGSQKFEPIDYTKIGREGVEGGVFGWGFGKVKVPTFSQGRNSFSAITQSLNTKVSNGTISNIGNYAGGKITAVQAVTGVTNGLYNALINGAPAKVGNALGAFIGTYNFGSGIGAVNFGSTASVKK